MNLNRIVAGLVAAAALAAGHVGAATFIVNDYGDNADQIPGDGLCQVPFTNMCSLRAAVQEANALYGPDIILLGPGTHTLAAPGIGEDYAATGDLDILEAVEIRGAGMTSTIVSANFIDRVFDVFANGAADVWIADLEIRYGYTGISAAEGGGIRNQGLSPLVLTGVSVYGNLAGGGAGIHSSQHTTVTLVQCSVAYNMTTDTSCGAGVTNYGGSLSILGSSIHHNIASNRGGGICNLGDASSPTSLFLHTSTVSDNVPDGVTGINLTGDTSMSITGSTIADNGGLGIQTLFAGAPPEIVCSIVSGHAIADCFSDTVPPIYGGGYTLSQDGSCSDVQTDIVGDPLLGPLTGGPGRPPGRAARVGSPVIDGGSNALCPAIDQWGRPRTHDGDRNGSAIADIGALEDVLLFADGFESGDTTAWGQTVR